jgi:hypothetical protein
VADGSGVAFMGAPGKVFAAYVRRRNAPYWAACIALA